MKVTFYDQEVVTPEARAIAARWASDEEVVCDGTEWSGPEPNSWRTVPNWRATTYMDRAMEVVEEARASVGEAAWWPLGEICRYELCQKLARLVFLRDTVAALERQGAREILWVTDRRGACSANTAEALAEGRSLLTVASVSHDATRRPATRSTREWLYHAVKEPLMVRSYRVFGRYDKPRMPPVLAATEFYSNSVRATGPILKQFQDDGYSVVGVPARMEIQSALARFGVPVHGLRSERRIPAADKEVAGVLPLVDALADGVGIRRGDARDELAREVQQSIVKGNAWLRAYRNVWQSLKPQGIVSSTYSGAYARAAAIAAHEEGIETFFVQHGSLLPRFCYSFFCQRHVLVWGDYFRTGLSLHGVEVSRLHVVGATTLEHAREPGASPRASRGPIDLRDSRIVYLAPRTGGALCSTELARRAAALVFEAAGEVGVGRVVVKLHPGDHTGEIERVASRWPNVECVRAGRPSEVLGNADLAVLSGSTAGYEACLLGLPSVFLGLPGLEDFCEFEALGAAVRVTSRDELAAIFSMLTSSRDVWASQRRAQEKMSEAVISIGEMSAVQRSTATIMSILGLSKECHARGY